MTGHDSILLSDAPVDSLETYLSQDGTLALRKALGMAPGEIVDYDPSACSFSYLRGPKRQVVSVRTTVPSS